MTKYIATITLALSLFPSVAWAQFPPSTVAQGGTGWNAFAQGAIPFGLGAGQIRLATSSALTFTNSASRLTFTYGSSTVLTATTLCVALDCISDITGTGLTITGGALTLNATGDWTGTFDGQEGSNYLARANHTGTQLAATISDFNSAAVSALAGLYEVPLTFTYPIVRTANTISLAFGTTTANNWSALNQFANANATLFSCFGPCLFGATGTTTVTTAGFVGIGSTTPHASLTLDRLNGIASSSIAVYEYRPATTTAATIDCRTSNTVHWRLGHAATTLTLTGFVPGQSCKVVVENPNGTAGALTWATAAGSILIWAGATTPTQTTTANTMEVWSFLSTQGSSTNAILGAQTANIR